MAGLVLEAPFRAHTLAVSVRLDLGSNALPRQRPLH